MFIKTLLFFQVSVFFIISISLQAQNKKEADAIIGKWLVEAKDAHVEIFKKADKYYGKIVWLKEPNEKDGTSKVDDENPDPKLQSRPLMGLEILKYFVYDDDYEWDDGEIYDPKTGNTYSCNIELQENGNKLKVRGYIGISLFGRTDYWTKVK